MTMSIQKNAAVIRRYSVKSPICFPPDMLDFGHVV